MVRTVFFRLALIAIALLFVFSASRVLADQTVPEIKAGDRVEAFHRGKWQPATVVDVNQTSGWIKVRVDDKAVSDLPANMRADFQTQELSPRWVRPVGGFAAKGTPGKSRPTQSLPVEKPQQRTWSDRAGKFTVDATFVELKDGTVGLLRADGKRIDVPLKKLSESDAKYVHSLEEVQNPFGDWAISSDKSSAPASGSGPASGDAKSLHPDWKSVKAVQPASFSKWTFQPAGGLPPADAKLPTTAVALGELPDAKKSSETIESLRVSQDGTRAIVVRQVGTGWQIPTFVQAVDLVKGHCEEPVQLDPATAYLDAFPEEGLLLLRSEGQKFGTRGTLILAKLDGRQVTPLRQWTPYESDEWDPDIKRAWFLASDRAMTIKETAAHQTAASLRGKRSAGPITSAESSAGLTIWDTTAAKALYFIPLADHSSYLYQNLTLSPDRRLLAVMMKDAVAIIDLQAIAHVATIPIEWTSVGHLAFSDDNRRLASLWTALVRWDLATGTKSEEFKHSTIYAQSKVQWAGELPLVNSRYLVDADRRILLWDFQSVLDTDKWKGRVRRGQKEAFWDSFAASESHGGRLWGVIADSDRPVQLISAAVPGEEPMKLDKDLPSPEKLLIMRPGDSVAIKVDVDPDIDSVDNVKTAIAANLAEAGFKVADSAALIVTAVCKRKPQQNIKINMGYDWANHQPGGIVERIIAPCVTTLQLTLNGEKVWSSGGLSEPGMTIFLQKDETLDQALERLTKPGIDWIKKRKYDPYLTRPGKATTEGAYGTSDLPQVDKPAENKPSGSKGILPALPGTFGVDPAHRNTARAA